MGLKEAQEELKKQIEEAQKAEGLTSEEEAVEEEQKKIESKEEKKEDAKEPEKKEEAASEEKKEKTNADYARERRERISEHQKLKEQLAAAMAQIEEMKKPKQEKEVEDPEPNKAEDPVAWADWRVRQAEKKVEQVTEIALENDKKIKAEEREKQKESLLQQAQNELVTYEDAVRKTNKDYDDVKKYYVNMLAFSMKALNPKITNDVLVKAVNHQVLMTASQYLNEGHENPVQAIYDSMKNMGYQPTQKETNEIEEKKPDLSKVAKNRERNAGMAGSSGGSGRGEMTKHYAATELTAAEWAKLPTAERERLMRQM